MNNIEIFRNEQFGEVRTTVINNEPWFVGKDVAEILGYTNPQKAIRDHVDEEDRTVNDSFIVNGTPIILINESGLTSKMPQAKSFKRWVTSKVLPAIRKTGGYIPISENESDEEFLARALIVAQNTLKRKEELITKQQQQLEIKDKELEHKENVIIGLVDNIDLATKRQRINQIVKQSCGKDYKKVADRWNLLYTEFGKKYHINLSLRFERNKDNYRPKLNSKLDLIEKDLNMIPQLYEIACKLFENDYRNLMKYWECIA